MWVRRFLELRDKAPLWSRYRNSNWPSWFDHNGRRRAFHQLRYDEWQPCISTRKSVDLMIAESLAEWSKVQHIYDRLAFLGVRQVRVEDIGQKDGFVSRISNEPTYRITLSRSDSLNSWMWCLGHEIGHLEAGFHGSKRLVQDVSRLSLSEPRMREFLRQARIEEAFADRFGDVWLSIPRHRVLARHLFVRLFR